MSNAPTECPRCGEDEFDRIWTRGRKFQYRCENCYWTSEPFIPPQQEIETEQVIYVGQFGGIEYILFDQYGHVMIMSRTYHDRTEAIKSLKDDLEKHPGSTAVLWPETVTAKGEIFNPTIHPSTTRNRN